MSLAIPRNNAHDTVQIAAERVRITERDARLSQANRARWLLALMLLPMQVARLFSPSMRLVYRHVEAEMMKNFKRKLLLAAMMGVVSVSAFGQKNGNDNKRPPKDPPKVVVKDKDKPPSNSNQGNKDSGKKGKP